MRRDSLATFGFLAAVVACGKSGRPDADRNEQGAASTNAAASAAPTNSATAPDSPFDLLWASASTSDNFRPSFTLKMTKEAYCEYVRQSGPCGDQFEPDKQYKADLDRAKVIRDSTWRVEVGEGFGNIAFRGKIGPGTFDAKRSVIPFNITWPIKLGSGMNVVEAAKRRLAVGDAIWKETPELLADLKFEDGAAARKWRDEYRTARFVFKVSDGVVGPEPLLVLKVLGMQLRDKHGVLAEEVSAPPDAGAAMRTTPADAGSASK